MLTLSAVGLQSEKPFHHPLEAKMRNYHHFLQSQVKYINLSQKQRCQQPSNTVTNKTSGFTIWQNNLQIQQIRI